MVILKNLPETFKGCGNTLQPDELYLLPDNGIIKSHDPKYWGCGKWRIDVDESDWDVYPNNKSLSYFFCQRCLKKAGILW